MGYDYGECLICYLKHGCNEDGPHYRNICFQCLDTAAIGRNSVGRVIYAIDNEQALMFSNCDKCNRNKVFVVYATICNPCDNEVNEMNEVNEVNKSTETNEMNETNEVNEVNKSTEINE